MGLILKKKEEWQKKEIYLQLGEQNEIHRLN